MRMGDEGFYLDLKYFNFSDAEFRREREGKRGREYLGETYRTYK